MRKPIITAVVAALALTAAGSAQAQTKLTYLFPAPDFVRGTAIRWTTL